MNLGGPDLERPRARLAFVASCVLVVVALLFIPLNLSRGMRMGVAADVALAVIFSINAWMAHRRPGSWFAVSLPVVGMLLYVFWLGPSGTIQAWLWAYGLPGMLFILSGHRVGLVINAVLAVGLGVMLLRWPPTAMMTHTEVSVAVSYTIVLGLAWLNQREHARLADELLRLSTEDHLTGLGNGRRFDIALDHELSRHRRYRRAFSVIVFDVDHFKQINDRHGHPEGDRVLREIGAAVRTTLRDTDLVARVGGDEFVALLPESDLARAGGGGPMLAARLREAVRASVRLEGQVVTLSMGVTTIGPEDDRATLLARADAALYQAKRAGRDGAVVLPADAPFEMAAER